MRQYEVDMESSEQLEADMPSRHAGQEAGLLCEACGIVAFFEANEDAAIHGFMARHLPHGRLHTVIEPQAGLYVAVGTLGQAN
jgi:hypothetical protein